MGEEDSPGVAEPFVETDGAQGGLGDEVGGGVAQSDGHGGCLLKLKGPIVCVKQGPAVKDDRENDGGAFRGRPLDLGQRIARVVLQASKDGRPLYQSLGFESSNEMRIKLTWTYFPRRTRGHR